LTLEAQWQAQCQVIRVGTGEEEGRSADSRRAAISISNVCSLRGTPGCAAATASAAAFCSS